MLLRLAATFLACALAVPAVSQGPDVSPADEHERLSEEFIRSRAENGESHASGARPDLGPVSGANPTQAVKVLRVGLHLNTLTSTGGIANEFFTLHHPAVELTNTEGSVKVIDRATGKEITVLSPPSRIRVEHDGVAYLVSLDGQPLGGFAGPVFFRPDSVTNQFRVETLRRSFAGVKVPLYRGAMEVARGPVTAALPPPARVNLVNIIEVEDYVPGVVVNESVSTFHVEALKAQAVAARGYAISNLGNWVRRGYPFDIVDSAASQVYRGVISEHVNAVSAATNTLGLVASSGGAIIEALYSSSFGGHSEDNEWIFNVPATQLPGTNARAYLRGIYDGEEPAPDFSTEAGIDAFWRTNPLPQINDDCVRVGNGFSRWKFPLSGATIKTRLITPFTTNPLTFRYVLISGNVSGSVTNVEIIQRMPASARAAVARITLTTGVVEVRGWDHLRNVLGRTEPATTPPAPPLPRACGTAVIAANFTLNNPSSLDVARNADGTVSTVTVWGGGWGHNLGMSQFGAHGRGRAGQSFLQILQTYYTGVDIGSYPIDIGREPGSGPPTLRQEFVAPNARGTLEIRASGLAGLRVHVNGIFDLKFDEAELAAGVVRADLSPYLVAGVNVIQYNPVGRGGTATVNVVVE
jgi:stage II sporulation protein D